MRIIGGEASGRTIASPKGLKVRPTPDMVREALFNILNSLQESTFLDLFAGTGSVGIEALSRGAKKVVFVEKDKRMAFQIKHFIKDLAYDTRADILVLDVKSGMPRLAKTHDAFDIVFADPPYEKNLVATTVQNCLDSGITADQGLLIMQHSRREPLSLLPSQLDSFTLTQERRYGDTMLSFLRFHPKEH